MRDLVLVSLMVLTMLSVLLVMEVCDGYSPRKTGADWGATGE